MSLCHHARHRHKSISTVEVIVLAISIWDCSPVAPNKIFLTQTILLFCCITTYIIIIAVIHNVHMSTAPPTPSLSHTLTLSQPCPHPLTPTLSHFNSLTLSSSHTVTPSYLHPRLFTSSHSHSHLLTFSHSHTFTPSPPHIITCH